MKTVFLLLMVVSVLVGSCSSGLKPRVVDQYYVSTGVEKYFLTDLPEWANYSVLAECYRESAIRYFNIEALMKSFSLSYFDAIQIQATFNDEYLTLKKKSEANLGVKDEEVIFFKASDKVKNKIHFFDAPTFKQIHLIWLDEALAGKKQEEKLKNFLESSVHNNGFPVLVSACLTKNEIEAKFPDVAVKVISAEMFSVYDSTGMRLPRLHTEIGAFFKPEQKLIFYSQGTKKNLINIKGTYKVSNY